jgi:phage N-6-adenine-methyltransferase
MTVYNSRTKSSKDDWETPPELFLPLLKVFRFNKDVAANQHNTLCRRYESDALNKNWGYHNRIWCNPPFSLKDQFLERALQFRQKSQHIVFLLPSNARETNWWNDFVIPYADEVINLIGRVNFYSNGKPTNGCNFPSCLVVFRPRLEEVAYGYPTELYWDWKNEKFDE